MKMTEAERQVMEVFWDNGPLTAKQAAVHLLERKQWSKTTSYTMFSKCIQKGYLQREEPAYLCTPLISREQMAELNTEQLVRRDYKGDAELLVTNLVKQKLLTLEQLDAVREALHKAEA